MQIVIATRKVDSPSAFCTLHCGHTEGQGENMEEVWKDIAGYEGLYQVSNLGRVKSLKKFNVNTGEYEGRVKLLKATYNRRGYPVVTLIDRTIRKGKTIHRLVAQAFIENPHNLPQVNHKDENKKNNNASNLEWCDNSYNHDYGTRIERCAAKLKKKVVQYSLSGVFIAEYDGVRDAAKANGFKANSSISECCVGKRQTAYGYIWKYKEAE